VNPREIVLEAIAHHETDVIPYGIGMEAGTREKLEEYYGGADKVPQHENFMAGRGCNWRAEELPDGGFTDIFGVAWRQGTTFQITEPVLKEPSLKGLKSPTLVSDEEVPELATWCEENADRFRMYNFGLMFFERAWSLRGMENLLMDMASEPAFVHELFERLMELHLEGLDKILHLPLDSIRFGDDFGAQHGTIMGLRHWRNYLKPRLARMYGKVREAGKIVSIHSCGDNSEILGEMIDMGLQVFNPAQPEANDLAALKKKFGSNVTFEGGIGSQVVIPFGTPDQVRQEVRRCRRVLGPGGGLIMQPTKGLRPEAPVENTVAAVETIIEEAHKGSPR